MRGLTTRLRNKIAVYGKQATINELGEDTFDYSFIKNVYGEIKSYKGYNNPKEGDITQVTTTHKITIRNNATKNITSDMYFVYKGLRYDIEYINPSFKYNDFIEVQVKQVQGSLVS